MSGSTVSSHEASDVVPVVKNDLSPQRLLEQIDARSPGAAALVTAVLEQVAQRHDAAFHNALLRQLIIGYADSQKELLRLNRELALRQRQLDSDLIAAAGIQRSLLPQVAPVFSNLAAAWRFTPSEKVGGDIFDIFVLDEHHAGFFMADVSGHGVPAALLTVSIHQTLQPTGTEFTKLRTNRPPYYEISDPKDVCTALDREYPFELFEKYFSIFYAVIDTRSGRLKYCNAGHPPPILLGGGGQVETLSQGGGIIGLHIPLPYETGVVALSAGDCLVAYTDGVTEHTNGQAEAFGTARLIESLHAFKGPDLDGLLSHLFDAVIAFGTPGSAPQDDIGLMAVQFGADAARVRQDRPSLPAQMPMGGAQRVKRSGQ